MSKHGSFVIVAVVVVIVQTISAFAQTYDINWHTVDGGGAMATVGGAYELSGTIGQPDANALVMAGGSFELIGGFWPVAANTCGCPGDMNGDGFLNGGDIQQFTTCLVAGGTCTCADLDGSPGLSQDDVTVFVADLLNAGACP